MKVKPSSATGKVVMEMAKSDEQLLAAPGQPAIRSFKLKKILVPVDFSDCSLKALRYAVPFARQFGAEVTLLHVVQPVYAAGEWGVDIDFAQLTLQQKEGAGKQLKELEVEEVGENIATKTLVRVGHPATEIAGAAKELGIDLIIIATHGHTGLKHVLMGSTAENVVRHAPCPVLTVRENEHEFVTG